LAAIIAPLGRDDRLSGVGADAAAPSPFHAAKWKAETLVRSAPIPWSILRPSLVLGPGDGITGPLAGLLRCFPVVPIPGRGQERHQPIDVDDLVRCIVLAANGEAAENEMVSVGGPMFVPLRQLVDLVAGELHVTKGKLLLPKRLIPLFASVLPGGARGLFEGPRLAQLQTGVVASPLIVQREFGFEPAWITKTLPQYLA